MTTPSESTVWTIKIDLTESSDMTEAKAVLLIDGHRMGGWGRARRNPKDREFPRIGEELATARALTDLAHQLIERAATLIELVDGEPANPHT